MNTVVEQGVALFWQRFLLPIWCSYGIYNNTIAKNNVHDALDCAFSIELVQAMCIQAIS
jgi:hypothetical protein